MHNIQNVTQIPDKWEIKIDRYKLNVWKNIWKW